MEVNFNRTYTRWFYHHSSKRFSPRIVFQYQRRVFDDYGFEQWYVNLCLEDILPFLRTYSLVGGAVRCTALQPKSHTFKPSHGVEILYPRFHKSSLLDLSCCHVYKNVHSMLYETRVQMFHSVLFQMLCKVFM